MNPCPEGFDLLFEGLTRICVPKLELYMRNDNVYEPSWAPVFYNPQMVENRDIAIGVVRYVTRRLGVGREVVIVDPLAATGVRGIRFCLETNKVNSLKVFMGDISEYAVNIMKINVRLNRVEECINIERVDANEYLYKLQRTKTKMDYIDIDPFGSPIPFLFSSISTASNGGIVAITATDLAVLTGKYTNKLYRRYGVTGALVPISRDIAIRALLSYIARISYSLDRYVKPILSYTYKHYIRTYIAVYNGASKADHQLKECLKSLRICAYCGYSQVDEPGSNIHMINVKCPLCGTPLVMWNPIWMCSTIDKNIIDDVLRDLNEVVWIQKSSRKLLQELHSHATIDAITVRLPQIARYLRTNVSSRNRVIECIERLGYRAVKSYIYPDGVVTNAPIADIIMCCKT
ncbi:MAG: hypothetical protein QW101_05145 [Ignisphaera sp.]|uniref:tRNA (guanine(26)-N(2))-dimethyltransferase n=1 Tax=Ignisphaera aggregans TaxID=334771 RepID=A0A7J3N0P6_9CREN